MRPYRGPKLTASVRNRPFWNKNKTLPLGGCLKVTFDHGIDGDTASFVVEGEMKTVRFFVIDTPELSPKPAPFGLSAKQYTTQKLQDAKEIYLQSDKLDFCLIVRKARCLLGFGYGELLNYQLSGWGLATVNMSKR